MYQPFAYVPFYDRDVKFNPEKKDTFYYFFEDLKVAHNDFGTKLPNYQLYQVFSHFFWKMYQKSCQVTYFTKLLAFFGGKTLHKLPNFPNYRGFNFWERPKVAHIEPKLPKFHKLPIFR